MILGRLRAMLNRLWSGSIIHPSLAYGKNFKVGNFCVIEKGVVIGDNVEIGNYVFLKEGTVIGSNVFIDSYVRSSGHNRISDGVTLRYGSTIAKNVVVGEKAFIAPNVMTIYSTHDGQTSSGTSIGKGAFVGTAAVLGPGVTIGEEVVIGAMAYVNKDCMDRGVYAGIPARKIG